MRFEITIRNRNLRLKLSDRGKIEIAQVAREIIEIQSRAGLSADGTPLIGKHGNRLTLYDTGELLNNVDIQPLKLIYKAEHALHVSLRFRFGGIAPQDQQQFETRIKPILDRELQLIYDN
jgi:hypothetical protein